VQAGGKEKPSRHDRPAPYNPANTGHARPDHFNIYVEVAINPFHPRSDALPWGAVMSSATNMPDSWLSRRRRELYAHDNRFPTRAAPTVFLRSHNAGHLRELERELQALHQSQQITAHFKASSNSTGNLKSIFPYTIGRRAAPPAAHAQPKASSRTSSSSTPAWSPRSSAPGTTPRVSPVVPRPDRMNDGTMALTSASAIRAGAAQPRDGRLSTGPSGPAAGTGRPAQPPQAPTEPANTAPDRQTKPADQINPFAAPHNETARRSRHELNHLSFAYVNHRAAADGLDPCRFEATM
jgi:hypothetical protein